MPKYANECTERSLNLGTADAQNGLNVTIGAGSKPGVSNDLAGADSNADNSPTMKAASGASMDGLPFDESNNYKS